MTARFIRMSPHGLDPMRADRGGLGTMPQSAFRYCEPMRLAAAYGWYLFPPIDIALRFNGIDTLVRQGDRWSPLRECYLPDYPKYWNERCPPEFHGLVPPFLKGVSHDRGVVQVWLGFLLQTPPGWSCMIRGLANSFQSNLFRNFEGIVESDVFSPFPVFANIQLLSSDCDLTLSWKYPLIQLQFIQRSSYVEEGQKAQIESGLGVSADFSGSMTAEDWRRFRETIRAELPSESHQIGDYGAAARKRAKRQD